jgi:tRNA threonylcarbamoyl adenosine modification protein YeaZ
MKILALEFSSGQRSAAVLTEGGVSGGATETGGRNTRAFELITRALAAANLEREQIECLAVGLGPGSYTGIRAAIAIAYGWQLARPVKLIGIPTVECLALEAQRRGWLGRINVIIDAQRDEYYWSRFEISPTVWQQLNSLTLASKADMLALEQAGEILAGPEAERFAKTGRVLQPTAEGVAQIAKARLHSASDAPLEPIYLRPTAFIKAAAPRILPAAQ